MPNEDSSLSNAILTEEWQRLKRMAAQPEMVTITTIVEAKDGTRIVTDAMATPALIEAVIGMQPRAPAF